MNNKGSMTVEKLVVIILAAVILVLIIAGVVTGGLKPLGEKIATQFNKVQLLFTKDKPTTGSCLIYSADCPGGCIKIKNGDFTGDLSLCRNACYFTGLRIDGENITYKYDYANEQLYWGNETKWESITKYTTEENIRLQEIYDEMIVGPYSNGDNTYLTKEFFDGKLYALKKPKVTEWFIIQKDVFGGEYVLYVQEGNTWKQLPITKKGYVSDYLVKMRLLFEEECK